jgi:hypothetical protein
VFSYLAMSQAKMADLDGSKNARQHCGPHKGCKTRTKGMSSLRRETRENAKPHKDGSSWFNGRMGQRSGFHGFLSEFPILLRWQNMPRPEALTQSLLLHGGCQVIKLLSPPLESLLATLDHLATCVQAQDVTGSSW